MMKLALHIFWLCLVLLLAARLEAATYYVATTGSGSQCTQPLPCNSIATAYGLTSAGDTVEVASGTYTINSPITLDRAGTSNAPITVKSATRGGAVLDFNRTAFDGLRITASYNVLDGFEIKNVVSDAIVVSDSDTTVRYGIQILRNNIHNNSRDPNHGHNGGGIFTWGSANGTIYRANYIHDNGEDNTEHGIYTYADNEIIEANIFVRNSGSGIQLASDASINSGSKIYNNTFADTSNGMFVWSTGGDFGTTEIKNNIFYNNSSCGINYYHPSGGPINLDRNIYYSNGAATCDTDVTATRNIGTEYTNDPQFVNPGNDNFTLQPGSAAINNGLDLGSPYNTDYIGVSRPISSGWDIGAYEYAGNITPPTPALVLAMPFDAGEGNTAVDFSGFNNTGSFSTGVTWDNSGKYGKALAFNGNGGVTIQPSNSLDLITGFTLEAWVNVASTSAVFRPIITKMRPDGTDYQYALYVSSENYLCSNGWAFSQANNAGAVYYQDVVCDTSLFPTNQWVHLAATYGGAGTSLALYRDGQIVSSITPPGTPVTSSGSLYIGWNPYPEGIIGKLDEIRVYNYPRTQAEIQTDMATPLTAAGPTAVIKISPATSLKLSATNGALKIGQ